MTVEERFSPECLRFIRWLMFVGQPETGRRQAATSGSMTPKRHLRKREAD